MLYNTRPYCGEIFSIPTLLQGEFLLTLAKGFLHETLSYFTWPEGNISVRFDLSHPLDIFFTGLHSHLCLTHFTRCVNHRSRKSLLITLKSNIRFWEERKRISHSIRSNISYRERRFLRQEQLLRWILLRNILWKNIDFIRVVHKQRCFLQM